MGSIVRLPEDWRLAEIARLRDENEELKERIKQLEAAAGLDKPLPPALGLTPVEGKLLKVLIARGWATYQSLYHYVFAGNIDGGPDPDIVKVKIHHLRKKIEPFGISIQTKWGESYYFEPADHQAMRDLIVHLTPENWT